MRNTIAMTFALFLCFGFVQSASAQSIGFHGIGGRIGLVKPENIDATLNVAAHANLGEIIENLVIFPSVDYWGKSVGPLDFSQFAINADGRYYLPASSDLAFFAGGGLSFIFTHRPVSFLGRTNGDTNLDLGLNLFGGLDYPLSDNLLLTGEGRFVVSDMYSFKLTAGVTYLLGK